MLVPPGVWGWSLSGDSTGLYFVVLGSLFLFRHFGKQQVRQIALYTILTLGQKYIRRTNNVGLFGAPGLLATREACRAQITMLCSLIGDGMLENTARTIF